MITDPGGNESREIPDRGLTEIKSASPGQNSIRSTPSRSRDYICSPPDMSLYEQAFSAQGSEAKTPNSQSGSLAPQQTSESGNGQSERNTPQAP